MENPEQEVLSALRESGDRDRAFRQLREIYCKRVGRFFASKKYSPQEQEDLSQETFLRVYKSMEAFEGNTSAELSCWVYRIAASIHSSQARRDLAVKRDAPEVSIEEVFAEGAALPDPTAADPLEELLQEERRQLLRREFGDLPKQARRVAELRYVLKFTMAEIALALNIEVDTVKAHLYQVKLRLMARLGKQSAAPLKPRNPFKR